MSLFDEEYMGLAAQNAVMQHQYVPGTAMATAISASQLACVASSTVTNAYGGAAGDPAARIWRERDYEQDYRNVDRAKRYETSRRALSYLGVLP
jgi:hypothetical protein